MACPHRVDLATGVNQRSAKESPAGTKNVPGEVVLVDDRLQERIVQPRLERTDGARVAFEDAPGEGIDLEHPQLRS